MGVPDNNWSDDDDGVFLTEFPWSVNPNIGSDESDGAEVKHRMMSRGSLPLLARAPTKRTC